MQKINSTGKKTNYLKSVGIGLAIIGFGYLILSYFVFKNKDLINNAFQKISNQTSGYDLKQNNNKNIEKKDTICKDNICFDVEYAISREQRQKGLMFRENLPEMSGMLFVFESIGMHRFWMKNTLIPLDIIRMDENYKVIYIEKNTPPCEETLGEQNICPDYGPSENTSYVLEINGGLSNKYGIKTGDKLLKY